MYPSLRNDFTSDIAERRLARVILSLQKRSNTAPLSNTSSKGDSEFDQAWHPGRVGRDQSQARHEPLLAGAPGPPGGGEAAGEDPDVPACAGSWRLIEYILEIS